jgi:hypothetical protein
VFSVDKTVCLSVANHGQLVRIVFPALVYEDIELLDENPAAKQFDASTPYSTGIQHVFMYSHTHQIFPTSCVPGLWDYPLRLCLAAQGVSDLRVGELEEEEEKDEDSAVAEEYLGGGKPIVTSLPPVQSISETGKTPDWSSDKQESLLKLHAIPNALPLRRLVWSEWTPEAMYWVLPTVTQSREGPVTDFRLQILVHADDSVLLSNVSSSPALLFYHYKSTGLGDYKKHVYEAGSVPLHGGKQEGEGKQYELKTIVERGLQLLNNTQDIALTESSTASLPSSKQLQLQLQQYSPHKQQKTYRLTASAARIHNLPLANTGATGYEQLYHPSGNASFSSVIHAEKQVQQVGFFTSFQDRRTRVRFVDRTLLEIDARQSMASFILQDGKQLEVPLPWTPTSGRDLPDNIGYYLEEALQFQNTAHQSELEQLETREQDAKLQHLVTEKLARIDTVLTTQTALQSPSSSSSSSEQQLLDVAPVALPALDQLPLISEIDRLLAMDFN